MRSILPAPPCAPAPSADASAWLLAHGAVSVRVGSDGVIEFSRRPLAAALTAAVRDLLPGGRPLSESESGLAHPLLQK